MVCNVRREVFSYGCWRNPGGALFYRVLVGGRDHRTHLFLTYAMIRFRYATGGGSLSEYYQQLTSIIAGTTCLGALMGFDLQTVVLPSVLVLIILFVLDKITEELTNIDDSD